MTGSFILLRESSHPHNLVEDLSTPAEIRHFAAQHGICLSTQGAYDEHVRVELLA